MLSVSAHFAVASVFLQGDRGPASGAWHTIDVEVVAAVTSTSEPSGPSQDSPAQGALGPARSAPPPKADFVQPTGHTETARSTPEIASPAPPDVPPVPVAKPRQPPAVEILQTAAIDRPEEPRPADPNPLESVLAIPEQARTSLPPATSASAVSTAARASEGADNPAPRYPLLARKRGYEGESIIRVVVGADGRVTHTEIVKSSGHVILDNAAREAIAEWRFDPAKRGERPVSGTIEIPIQFRLL